MFTKFSPCLQLIFKCYTNIFNGKTKNPCPKKKKVKSSDIQNCTLEAVKLQVVSAADM